MPDNMLENQDGRRRGNLSRQTLKPRSYCPETDEGTVVEFYLDLMRGHYRLWSELVGEHHDAEHWERVLVREEAGERWARELRNRVEDPDSLLLIFTADRDEPIGFLLLEIQTDHLIFCKKGFIHGIFLHPDYRGRGWSRQMLAWGERWFHEKGVSPRHVYVISNNLAAVKLYASMGYRVTDYRMTKIGNF
ncbi:GNAT family N-acetyltransferase [Kroppenstedtia eburnea]|uniref:Acetyltransferase (GNAT) family protein n=1 Tax=Kroppenstedtia eburnea TaxID=714067 RepID=A0A1N7L7N6_9BACL|nr:GNAT family N-acetyltransferase [Kroppenstedtia eburnea]QKI81486.1 GNAT family N-acetyltransferase [Kroppenstedtia eburnea]SIS69844.1 Acetyltransferase (GNAT) family protein [Kroppenstedtia eburnea]